MFAAASYLKRTSCSPNFTIRPCSTVRGTRIHAISGSISARHFKNSSLTGSPCSRLINSVGGTFIPAPPFVTAKTPPFLRFPCFRMVETQKRFHSTDKKHGGVENHNHKTNHGEENGHSHSFSVFGHSHSHEEHSRDADQLIAALKGSGACLLGTASTSEFDSLSQQGTVAVTSLLSDSSLISP